MATELQGSLQSMKEGEIVSVLAALASIQGQLVSESSQISDRVAIDLFQQISNELVIFMHLSQNELYEVCVPDRQVLRPSLTVLQRVQDLDQSFSGLESKAYTLHEAQIRQAEMQAHLHNQTQVEMQASRSLIANVTSSARGLHEAVDDAAAKIAKMAWSGAIPGDLFKLAWLILALAVLHRYSPNHAKFVAAVIGVFPNATEISMLIQSPRIHYIHARFWYSGWVQVNPFGPNNHPLRFRLPSPLPGTYKSCCDASHYSNSRYSYLPNHECFQPLALPWHEE